MLLRRTFPTISSVARESGLTLHTAVVTPPWRDNLPLNSPRRMAPFLFSNRTVMRCRNRKETGRGGGKINREGVSVC